MAGERRRGDDDSGNQVPQLEHRILWPILGKLEQLHEENKRLREQVALIQAQNVRIIALLEPLPATAIQVTLGKPIPQKET